MTLDVTIVIPTFRRPERALAAARSALAQDTDAEFEIVIVDNDPSASAFSALHELGSNAARTVTIVHEPRAGVANARNAGLKAARGQFIAFLDDDEHAPANWLHELLRTQKNTNADVVFGPVHTQLTNAPRDHREYFDAFFARDPGHMEGPINTFYGCGNSLVRRAALPSAEPFSAERNEIGGEDDLLFQGMQAAGASFAWSPSAIVFESPEPSRVTLTYTLKRAFAYGQGPATKAWSAKTKDFPAIAFWMAIGAAQTVVFGAAALGSFLGKTSRRAFAYRRFVEGLGKLLWFPVIKPKFYGAAKLPKEERAEAAA